MTEEKKKYTRPEDFDAAAYTAGFDDIMAKLRKMTLGRLIERVQSLAEMSEELKSSIAEALTRRNFLAHHFFYERAVQFMTDVGRLVMTAELESDIDLLQKVDQDMSDFVAPYLARIGYTEASLT